MAEESLTIGRKDIEQDGRLSALERHFDLLDVKLIEREKADVEKEKILECSGKKIDWRAIISAAGLAITFCVVIVGGVGTLYMSDALKPLEALDLAYGSRLTTLERDLAVQVETVSASRAAAIEAAEKLVDEIQQDVARSFTDADKLSDEIERLKEQINQTLGEERFEERIASLGTQRAQAVESVRAALTEDISRLDVEGTGIAQKIDDLEDELAKTLGVTVFEERFTFLREQREDDLAVLRIQREGDQAALFRIIGDRITPRLSAIETRLVKLEDRIQEVALKSQAFRANQDDEG